MTADERETDDVQDHKKAIEPDLVSASRKSVFRRQQWRRGDQRIEDAILVYIAQENHSAAMLLLI